MTGRCARFLLAMLGLFLSFSTAGAAEPDSAAKDKVVIYSGATVIDGTGAGARADMAIVARGERIEAIVPQAELKAPEGAEVVDVKGQYALPGFINSHEHLATPPDRKFAEAMMRRDLYGGVTAVRCMGDDLRALADLARASRVAEFPGRTFITRRFLPDAISWRIRG